jgi:hypothetical protein
MNKLLFLFLILAGPSLWAQNDDKTEIREYLNVRVIYGKNTSGYKYELFIDIGTSGSHSLSGYVTNMEDKVIIKDDNGQHVFSSDIDLLNFLAASGWKIIHTGQVDVLGEPQNCYLLERILIK